MFVRTKTGIYDLELKDNKGINYYQINDDFEEETYGGKTGRVLYIPSKAVLKKADTIAELCDEFMIYCPIDNSKTLYKSLYTLKKGLNKRLFIKDNLIIYGCNWTDKGLIYVAKMNDEGDFKLI